MAFTADTIIANIESRLGESGTHVWDYYKLARGTPWCAGEICYTFAHTGNRKKIFGGSPVFYVPTAQVWLAEHYDTVYDYRRGGDLSRVRKGDIVIFMWTRGSRDHIGFARADGDPAVLSTVEGDTSGGKVAHRTRAKQHIYGVYRPPYAARAKKQPTYRKGKTYATQVSDLNVRTGPGTEYPRKTRNDLTADGRKHADADGQLKKGTKVTCQGSKTNGSEVWIRIPSGWICAYNGSKYYVR